MELQPQQPQQMRTEAPTSLVQILLQQLALSEPMAPSVQQLGQPSQQSPDNASGPLQQGAVDLEGLQKLMYQAYNAVARVHNGIVNVNEPLMWLFNAAGKQPNLGPPGSHAAHEEQGPSVESLQKLVFKTYNAVALVHNRTALNAEPLTLLSNIGGMQPNLGGPELHAVLEQQGLSMELLQKLLFKTYNAAARIHNRSAFINQPLMWPFNDAGKQPQLDRPHSLADFPDDSKVVALLLHYNLNTDGAQDERRKRLHQFIGIRYLSQESLDLLSMAP